MIAWKGKTQKRERWIRKRHEEMFGGDGYVHYLYRGDGFTCDHIGQNSSKWTL